MPAWTRIPPFLVVSVVGAVAFLCVSRVQFSASLYEMLPPDLPEVQGMDRLNRYFGRDGQLIVTVSADEAHVVDEAVGSLAATMRERSGLVADVHRELSLTELVTEGGGLLAWVWFNAAPEVFARLASRIDGEGSAATIADSMAVVQEGFFDEKTIVTSYDPLGFSRLDGLLGVEADGAGPDPMTSEDGTFQLIYVEGAGVDFSSYRDAAVWLERMQNLVSEWQAGRPADSAEVRIGLTGTPAFMAEVGTEMERDMTVSVFLTLVLISLLFWVMYRKTRPLGWLVSTMLAVLAVTIGIGGVLFGDLSVMSAGFAAILMGLAVDYGIVIYREAEVPGQSAAMLRKAVGPSIVWAAATTAVVFLSLNLSSLPGLSEMGNLVAIGVLVGAVAMLFGFAPVAATFAEGSARVRPARSPGPVLAGTLALAVPVVAIASAAMREMPDLEANFHPFRIRESPSMVAWQQLQSELRGRENSVPTVIIGESVDALRKNVIAAGDRIETAEEEGLVLQSVLPTAFLPAPEHQRANAIVVRSLLGQKERVLTELAAAGFSEEGARLAGTVFDRWELLASRVEAGETAFPVGAFAEWSVGRLFSREDGVYAALATVKPANPTDRAWVAAVSDRTTAVASLGSLGTALNERIRDDLLRVFLPMMGILSAMLAVVFRSWRDLSLCLFSLFFSAAGLVLLTVWTPMSWNSFNVCGLPLLFGTGLDFGIHTVFALRRNGGDLVATRNGIGKALLFCGTSSAIGFGSLATASAHGLASLGIVCAAGILLNMAVAVWLLPVWYRRLHGLDRLS